MDKHQAWVHETAKLLVDIPEKVSTNLVNGEQTDVIELTVDQSDLGKVIGKKGKLAHSMRTCLMAMATKEGKRVVLEILDPKKRVNKQHD